MGMAAYGDPHRFNLSELFSFSADHEALFMNSQLINNQSTSCFESHCNAPFISSVVDIPLYLQHSVTGNKFIMI